MFTSFGEIFLSIVYISIFSILIGRSSFFSDKTLEKKWFYFGFILKLLAGFSLTYIYTYYYTDRLSADIYKYFDDSMIMFDSLSKNPSHFFSMLTGINDNTKIIEVYYDEMLNWYKLDLVYNDNHILIRINAILRFFSLGYFSVHTIVMVFFSYCGLVALFHVFKNYLNCNHIVSFLSLLLLPSLLFWTSGVLKDSLLLGLFGLFLYQIEKLKNQGINPLRVISILVLGILLIQVKLYVLMIAFPGIIIWLFLKNKKYKLSRTLLIWAGTYALYFSALGNIQHILPHYNFPQMIAVKQYHFKRLAQFVESGSYIEMADVKPTLSSIILNTPNAFLTVLSRPHLLEAKSILTAIAAVENSIFILLLILSIVFIKKVNLLNPSKLFLFSIIFVVCLFVLIGLVTPVMGAIVRYKTIALPFLMFIILYLLDWSKNKYFKKLRKLN